VAAIITFREILTMTISMLVAVASLSARCDFTFTVLMCATGALLGLTIGMIGGWLALDMALQSWEAQRGPTIRLPAPLNDARHVGALIFYGIPFVLASVGAGTAYYLCMARV
jgi:hypothetical protein